MRKLLLFLSFLFLFTQTATAKAPFGIRYLVGGVAYSSFTTINTDGIFRPLFGIGYKWEKSNSAISIGIILITRGGILRNKTLRFPIEDPRDVYLEDLYFSITYFEIPFYLKYYFSRNRFFHSIKLQFLFGPSVLIPIRYSYYEKRKDFSFRYIPGYNKTYHFDYEISQDNHFILGDVNLGANVGFGVAYNSFSINIIYSYELLPFGNVRDISKIERKSNSLNLILHIVL